MNPIRFYKMRAKQLHKAYKAGDEEAINRVHAHIKDLSSINLMKVQHAIAREAGYNNWKELRQESGNEDR